MTDDGHPSAPSATEPRHFQQEHLLGARFEEVDLSGASFHQVRLRGATVDDADLRDLDVREAFLHGARFRGVVVDDVRIDGDVQRLVVNGVDVAPLVEAELDRRHPERRRLRPTTPQGYREAWQLITDLWADTVDRARLLAPSLLHDSVDGEWSFIETLRHLAHATECWVSRVLLGDPVPWHPLSLPCDGTPPDPQVPHDREVRPTLDEALALRHDRMAVVRRYLDALDDDLLASTTEPVGSSGWPEPRSYPVKHALDTVLEEEWWHRQFAERDLALLGATPAAPQGAGHA